MIRTVTCSFGNCEKEMITGFDFKVMVTVTAKGGHSKYRQPYCSYEHAALDLQKQHLRTIEQKNVNP